MRLELPEVQRFALEVALLEKPPGTSPIEQSAVAAGVLSLLRLTAADQPVLIAIDDLQWMDETSAVAVGYAVRRVSQERIGLLATERIGGAGPFHLGRSLPAASTESKEIGPLLLEDFDAMLASEFGERLHLPQVAAIHRACSGNPFFGTELTRAALSGRLRIESGRPLRLPTNLDLIVADRLKRLPAVLDLLTSVAALSYPSLDELAALNPHAGELLAAAEDEGVLVLDAGRIRFTHPLLGSAAYSRASASALRSLHARLAKIVADPEEVARHLALAADGPDEQVAIALETAAARATARGAPSAASGMAEEAVRMTPPGDRHSVALRKGVAAKYHADAGHMPRAVQLLDEALPHVHGPERARLLLSRATCGGDPGDVTISQFAEAVREARSDPPLAAWALINLAWNLTAVMRPEEAYPYARRALDTAARLDDPDLLARAVAMCAASTFYGSGNVPGDEVRRALALGHEGPEPVGMGPRSLCGRILMWGDELDVARPLLTNLLHDYIVAGLEPDVAQISWFLAFLEFRAGDWKAARAHARRCTELNSRIFGEFPMAGSGDVVAARLDACAGELDTAGMTAVKDLEGAARMGEPSLECHFRSLLGFVAFMQGDHLGVVRYLDAIPGHIEATSLVDPGIFRYEPELIGAHLRLGHRDRADSLVRDLEARGRRIGRGWASAAARRCRGLWLVGGGDSFEGARELQRSVTEFEELGQPFELARSLLALGAARRRARKKADARSSFTRAHEIFSSLGASAWATKAQNEATRIGGRAPSRWELTSTETEVAALAAEGQTNKEVAESLFISPKTVEWTLTNVYRKLQVRSRTELAERLNIPGRT